MGATRMILAAAAAFAVAVSVGCSGSSDDGAARTTQPVESTTSTLDDAEFEASANELATAVESAGTDICAVNNSLNDLFALPTPTTPEQAERSVELLQTMFDAIADALPPESAEAAGALRSAGESLAADAAENNYDPAWLDSGSSITQDDAFLAGLAEFQSTAAQTCDAPAGPTDAPTGG